MAATGGQAGGGVSTLDMLTGLGFLPSEETTMPSVGGFHELAEEDNPEVRHFSGYPSLGIVRVFWVPLFGDCTSKTTIVYAPL